MDSPVSSLDSTSSDLERSKFNVTQILNDMRSVYYPYNAPVRYEMVIAYSIRDFVGGRDFTLSQRSFFFLICPVPTIKNIAENQYCLFVIFFNKCDNSISILKYVKIGM